MTLKVVNEIIDTMPVLIFLVQESDFSALLIAQVTGGFSPKQPGTFTFIDYIDIQFNRSSWWHSEAVGEYVHIRHGGFDYKSPTDRQILITSTPHL